MIVRKILSIISDIGIALVIATVLSVYIFQFIGINTFIVRSGSMEPTFLTGSLCFVDTKSDYDEVKVGDVIAFKLQDSLVTHRVIEILPEGMVTKGDNNDISDGLTTTKDNFVGENILALPYLGYGLSWIQTKKGKILTVTVVLALIVINIILSEMDINNKKKDSE